MKVAYFTGLRQLELREEAAPVLTHPHDVLVRIDRVGVCGSDVHYFTHGRIGDQVLGFPTTLGHECSGTVVQVGPAAEKDGGAVVPGQRVAIDPAFSCGECDQCRTGRENTCRAIRFMGSPGEAPGAAAEYCVLPARNCFALPQTVSLDAAVLAEPLSIGLHAVWQSELVRSQRIAILGAGPIGLSVLLCAKKMGVRGIYASEPIEARRKAAADCGADWTGDPTRDDVVREIMLREPKGLNMVFECSGDPAAVDQAMDLLAPGGKLVWIGIPTDERVSFRVHVMRRKELTFVNVRRQRHCVRPAIQMLAHSRDWADRVVTHRFPMAEIGNAFELVAARKDGVIKALVCF